MKSTSTMNQKSRTTTLRNKRTTTMTMSKYNSIRIMKMQPEPPDLEELSGLLKGTMTTICTYRLKHIRKNAHVSTHNKKEG